MHIYLGVALDSLGRLTCMQKREGGGAAGGKQAERGERAMGDGQPVS